METCKEKAFLARVIVPRRIMIYKRFQAFADGK
jgi:hypothetical protein